MSIFKKLVNEKKGQILPIMAIGIAVFLGFAAISVDYGYLAWQRRELQNIADSSALAAAWELPDATDSELKLVAEEYAEDYSDSRMDGVIVEYAEKVYGNRAVEVKVKKDYNRMFGMIFQFFDDTAEDSDVMSAGSTAEKTLIWDLDLLPIIDLDVYPIQDLDFPGQGQGAVKLIPDPVKRNYTLAEYKAFMIDRMNETVSKYDEDYYGDGVYYGTYDDYPDHYSNRLELWGSNDISGNFGLVELENEDGDNPSLRDVINQTYRIDLLSIIVKPMSTEHGQVQSIEAAKSDLSDRITKDGNRAFVLAIKPGAIELANEQGNVVNLANLQSIGPGNYLLVYLTDINLGEEDDAFISGKISGVYNLTDEDDIEELRTNPDIARLRIIK